MKYNVIRIWCVVAVLFLFSAQRNMAQVDFNGHWYAHCVIEQAQNNSISFSSFCFRATNSPKSEIQFTAPELIFDISANCFDLITLQDTIKVAYTIDYNHNSLAFTYRETAYVFHILMMPSYSEDCIILKDDSGAMLLLVRKP